MSARRGDSRSRPQRRFQEADDREARARGGAVELRRADDREAKRRSRSRRRREDAADSKPPALEDAKAGKEKPRRSRSRRRRKSSSSSSSRRPAPRKRGGGFDQSVLMPEDLAIREQMAKMTTTPAVPLFQPQVNPAVEAFLAANPVEAHAVARLRSLPFEQQQVIISHSLAGARDPTAVLIGRIRKVAGWVPAEQFPNRGLFATPMTNAAATASQPPQVNKDQQMQKTQMAAAEVEQTLFNKESIRSFQERKAAGSGQAPAVYSNAVAQPSSITASMSANAATEAMAQQGGKGLLTRWKEDQSKGPQALQNQQQSKSFTLRPATNVEMERVGYRGDGPENQEGQWNEVPPPVEQEHAPHLKETRDKMRSSIASLSEKLMGRGKDDEGQGHGDNTNWDSDQGGFGELTAEGQETMEKGTARVANVPYARPFASKPKALVTTSEQSTPNEIHPALLQASSRRPPPAEDAPPLPPEPHPPQPQSQPHQRHGNQAQDLLVAATNHNGTPNDGQIPEGMTIPKAPGWDEMTDEDIFAVFFKEFESIIKVEEASAPLRKDVIPQGIRILSNRAKQEGGESATVISILGSSASVGASDVVQALAKQHQEQVEKELQQVPQYTAQEPDWQAQTQALQSGAAGIDDPNLTVEQKLYQQAWVQHQMSAQMALFEAQQQSGFGVASTDPKPGFIKRKSTQPMLPGDWECPKCGDHQFSRNWTCRACGALRPD